MDGASGVIAIVSFSVQLVESIQKVNKFLKEVRNAPEEVVKLVNAVEEFEHLSIAVDGLIKKQSMTKDLPGTVGLERAFKGCRSTIATLENCVNAMKASLDSHGRLHRAWASIQIAGKKGDVKELRKEVERSMSKLQTALTTNNSYLQVHQIELFTTLRQHGASIQQTKLVNYPSKSSVTKPRDLVASHKNIVLKSKVKDIWQYRTLFGEFRLRKKYISLPADGLSSERPLSEESYLLFAPYLLSTVFELRSFGGVSQVPWSLSQYPVIQDFGTFLEWCYPRNAEKFKQALSHRELSPYSRDSFGRTFLHAAIAVQNVELCSLFTQIGVDINHMDDYEGKAYYSGIEGENAMDIARIILNGNCDIDLEDLSRFLVYYRGSPDAIELLLSACGISNVNELVNNENIYNDFIRTALGRLGGGSIQWRPWIQRLLDFKMDVHVSRSSYLKHYYARYISLMKHTLLDCLFKDTECPFEAERVAQDWLLMLREAGYNVNEYLEEERLLHSNQDCLTTNHAEGYNRRLVFTLDGMPRVGWEWWFDPQAPGSLVCHEFRNMNLIFNPIWPAYVSDTWESAWPFTYPEWLDDYYYSLRLLSKLGDQEMQDYEKHKKLRSNAACRQARQTQMKYPKYFRELNKDPAIPGAWVGD